MNKHIQRGLALVGAIVVSGSALADTGPDFTTLTSAISFSTVIAGVMAIALSLVGVRIAIKGATILLSMIKRG